MKELQTLMRILAWICLVATVSGPFLREAEGAEDLVRSLAELGCALLVEEVDGGVGDDSGATIIPPSTCSRAAMFHARRTARLMGRKSAPAGPGAR